MPTNYGIDVEQQLVFSRASGDVTDAELFNHQSQLARDPLFHRDFSQLADFLGVTSSTGVTAKGIMRLAQEHLYGPSSRRAFVASDPASFGLARMFETYRDISQGEEQIRVFKNLKDARLWLGIIAGEVSV
jgi:hypothetical protein